MDDDKDTPDIPDLPHGPKGSSVARGALNVVGGLVPFAGGLLSAAASAWSEHEQNKINDFLHPRNFSSHRHARRGNGKACRKPSLSGTNEKSIPRLVWG
jgi:hypothetical protein